MSLQVCESSAVAVLLLLRLALSPQLDLTNAFMTYTFVGSLFLLLALNLWNAGEITHQMGSRSKRLIQLAVAAETAGIPLTVVGTKKEETPNVEDTTSITDDGVSSKNIITNATDDVAVQKDDSIVSNRRRCDSTSSSSSSSSDSSSSSSSSGPSFIEDSDDSVKDPNYETVETRHRTLSCSDSDIEDVNASLLSSAMFYCGWHLCDTDQKPHRDIRRLVLIGCAQAQKPLVLKAFGVQALSYETFVSVARMTYSVFAVFYQRGE
ncbi:hypothetical protein K1T71_009302 [Dendrolimus kikuchii]|uniref:Uncharacterized protein n=1 Tax=Dendrolimus kikuchii TaxID=765133 RepID=A0ACC1CUC7_9NEOP|nr:hypothetical protein K1T71_009302 [Dendrolimus kikuchii]